MITPNDTFQYTLAICRFVDKFPFTTNPNAGDNFS